VLTCQVQLRGLGLNLVVREDEELLLELLNTTPIVDGARVDHLADLGAAQEWAAEHGGVGTGDEVTRVRGARAALQAGRSGVSPACSGLGVGGICRRETCGPGAAGLGGDSRTRAQSPPAMCEWRMPPLPPRPQQREHRPMVFYGVVWQPAQGSAPLPAHPNHD
jgi:hypothetical protein